MKFDFPNNKGEILSGKLELPKGEPKAFALFAHCFTCSKDIVAPNFISKALTKNGVAVLRFDFTGLGNSQGDFANTNFSSNVEDLLSACKYLGEKYEHPEVLIGHSLGGAAVLKAALKLPKVKAIATIGAPSSIEHVTHLFSNEIETIEKEGKAEVNLAGRKFTIKKHFIDDLKNTDITTELKNLKKSLLVMHSPLDDTVSVEHAAKIFTSAKHPKSFITLDKASHLLMNRDDAMYAGDVIGAWALRYISKGNTNTKKKNIENGVVLVQARKGEKFTQDIYTKDHQAIIDEPLSYKGANLGMTPYNFLLAGLGACTSMTVKMYAERKGIQLDDVKVKLKHNKVRAEDCETETGKVDIIEKQLFLEGNFTDGEKARLYEVAERCPVYRTLQSEIKIISN